MKVRVVTFTVERKIFFFSPIWVVKPVGRIEMFFSYYRGFIHFVYYLHPKLKQKCLTFTNNH
jgi:hypothetical protein